MCLGVSFLSESVDAESENVANCFIICIIILSPWMNVDTLIKLVSGHN